MMRALLRGVLVGASRSGVLRRQVTGRAATRNLALRFVAGDTLDDGLHAARRLARQDRTVTLNSLGEEVADPAQARAGAKTYLETLARVGEEGLPAGVSVKPTQLGLDVAPQLCLELLAEVAAAADQIGAHVTLDMEGSPVTAATIALVERLHAAGHRHVGCALQAYLRRTPGDVERLSALGASLRLCKGAYAEPPAVAHQRRAEVDASFATLADWLLEHGSYPRLATHDDRLVDRARNTAARLGRGRDDFEFQMLYGVRPRLQDALVRDGYRLRVYVPFGDQWYPYFMRRLAERPANLVFFLRALRGG
ncbi:MAG TPA: proline dehydrogenase family protein [Egibacteraceae bacterium]|nr:proline dehydrogenase family protein [Egibacteraceae bacterium]